MKTARQTKNGEQSPRRVDHRERVHREDGATERAFDRLGHVLFEIARASEGIDLQTQPAGGLPDEDSESRPGGGQS